MPKKGESKKQRVSEQIIGPLGDPGSLYFQMKQFLQYQRERSYSERTVGNREHLLIAFIRWCDERGLTRPQEITRPILERYQRHLFLYRKANGEALSARSQTVRITPIRVWFKWLTKTNRILYNPASDLDLPRMEQRLPKHILSSDEAERILNVPDSQTPTGIRDRAMLET
ncbi:MAG: site-specific integrase, partial [Burkholderiales bacterium]